MCEESSGVAKLRELGLKKGTCVQKGGKTAKKIFAGMTRSVCSILK